MIGYVRQDQQQFAWRCSSSDQPRGKLAGQQACGDNNVVHRWHLCTTLRAAVLAKLWPGYQGLFLDSLCVAGWVVCILFVQTTAAGCILYAYSPASGCLLTALCRDIGWKPDLCI
jgi:hypothetical protein